jgi:hypothetical protein
MSEPLDEPGGVVDVAEPWILGTRRRRVLVALLFTIVPLASFALADGFVAPDWQDGNAEWSSVFANEARGPLETIALAVFGLGMVLIAERPSARHRPHGTAILLGATILSGFYAITLAVATGGATLIFATSLVTMAAAASVAALAIDRVRQWARSRELGLPEAGAALVLFGVAVTLLPPLQGPLFAIAAWAVFSILGTGPFLCLAVAGRLLVDRAGGRDGRDAAAALPALGVTVASIYVTWQRALEHHATLSPTDPYADCYVASAAAHGHRAVVGSWSAPTAHGTVTVTRQLVDLKAVELLVRVASPRLHRCIRFGYDRVGPRLARRITSPLQADLAWGSLLPLGLAARLILAPMPTAVRDRVAQLHPPAADRPVGNQ